MKIQNTELWQEVDSMRGQFDNLKRIKATKKDLANSTADLTLKLEKKVENEEVQTAFSQLQSEISQKMKDAQHDFKQKLSKCEQRLNAQIEEKATMQDLSDTLQGKTDTQTVKQWVDRKANSSDISSLKKEIKRLAEEIEAKATSRDLSNHAEYLKLAVQDLKKNIHNKANMKDLLSIIETKTDRDDFEASLAGIKSEMIDRLTLRDMQKALDQQALVNETLCAENCIG